MFGINDSNTAAELQRDHDEQKAERHAREVAEYDMHTVKNHRDMVIRFRETRHKHAFDEMADEITKKTSFGNYVAWSVFHIGIENHLPADIIKICTETAFYQCQNKLEGDWTTYEDLLEALNG